MLKSSTSDIRFILAFPFGLVAEIFAMLTVVISGGQCDVNFNRFNKEFIEGQE